MDDYNDIMAQLPPDIAARLEAMREAEAMAGAEPVTDEDLNGHDPDVLDVMGENADDHNSSGRRRRARPVSAEDYTPKDRWDDLGEDKFAALYGDNTDGFHIVSRGHGGTRGFPRRRRR